MWLNHHCSVSNLSKHGYGSCPCAFADVWHSICAHPQTSTDKAEIFDYSDGDHKDGATSDREDSDSVASSDSSKKGNGLH